MRLVSLARGVARHCNGYSRLNASMETQVNRLILIAATRGRTDVVWLRARYSGVPLSPLARKAAYFLDNRLGEALTNKGFQVMKTRRTLLISWAEHPMWPVKPEEP